MPSLVQRNGWACSFRWTIQASIFSIRSRYHGYVSNYWGCPKCGNLTLRLEDKDGHCDVATCEYDQCDYFDEGVPA
jgi:hypothetical protein